MITKNWKNLEDSVAWQAVKNNPILHPDLSFIPIFQYHPINLFCMQITKLIRQGELLASYDDFQDQQLPFRIPGKMMAPN